MALYCCCIILLQLPTSYNTHHMQYMTSALDWFSVSFSNSLQHLSNSSRHGGDELKYMHPFSFDKVKKYSFSATHNMMYNSRERRYLRYSLLGVLIRGANVTKLQIFLENCLPSMLRKWPANVHQSTSVWACIEKICAGVLMLVICSRCVMHLIVRCVKYHIMIIPLNFTTADFCMSM